MPIWAMHAIGTFGYAAIFVLIALEGLGIPLPGETALLVGAALAGSVGAALDIRLVIATAAAGAIIGDTGGFFLGRIWGRSLIERLGPRFGLSSQHITSVEGLFRRYGVLAVFFGRYQAVLRTYVGFVAGAAHMPLRLFFPVRLASCVIWAFLFGLFGYYLGRQWPLLATLLHRFSLASLALVVLFAAVATVWVVMRHPRSEGAQR